MLSAQSTDRGVNKATAVLFRDARTPQAIVDLGAERLMTYIGSLGLFRNKAKNVVALSEQILRHHGGEVPQTREALESSDSGDPVDENRTLFWGRRQSTKIEVPQRLSPLDAVDSLERQSHDDETCDDR